MSRVLMLFCFSLGIFSVGFWPFLPDSIWLIFPAVISCFLYINHFRMLALLFWGVIYGVCWGHYSLSHQLPEELNPYELIVTGKVIGLPTVENNRTRFYMEVHELGEKLQLRSEVGSEIELKKLRLNWYSAEEKVKSGQVWRLKVKLRRPRGTINPGGFDYQAWLLRQGVSATGYVRKSDDNQLLSTQMSLGVFRFHIREAILMLPLSDDAKSLIVALTVGDRSMITSQLWDDLAFSGVVHLMVVSGLHIGLIAYFFYLLGAGIARLICAFNMLCNTRFITISLTNFCSINARYWGCFCSLLASVVYSSLAGFSLPTQRALVMISVAILALLLDRKVSRGLGFSMALSGVAMIDPLAFHSAGFWLSFGAVACLLWLIPVYVKGPVYTKQLKRGQEGIPWTSSGALLITRLKQFFYVQWLLFLALTIPLLLFQLPISWFGPWVNLFAIPWISFVIVPLCLVGTALLFVNEVWAVEVWNIAGWQLNYFIDAIRIVSGFSNSLIIDLPPYLSLPNFFPLPKTWVVSMTLILVLALLLLPRGIAGKYLLFPLLLLLAMVPFSVSHEFLTSSMAKYFLSQKLSSLKVSVLDVGQGLSVVVQTEGKSGKHTLVYDTGPGYEDGFNMAGAVVIPYLRYSGETGLDMLVVSHGDNDHAGGTKHIVDTQIPGQIVLGEDVSEGTFPFSYCKSGDSWQWDDVYFEFLHPIEKEGRGERKSNNRSCVLKITYKEQMIILPGDIESSAERQLQRHNMLFENPKMPESSVTLLVAPHHGSKTSSSTGFVHLLSPKHVVFSAGHKHHFGHPAGSVLQRYKDVGSKVWSTADHGAIEFIWDEEGLLTVSNRRMDFKRYWY